MRKIGVLLTALIIVFSVSAFAADKPADVNEAGANKADVKKQHHFRNHLFGEVKAVDSQAGSLTVVGKKGEKTLTADPALLKDVKVGDKVVVRFAGKDGVLIARSIKPAGEKKEHFKNLIRGKVTAIDSKAGSITVRGKKGEQTLSADAGLLGKVKVGQRVFVKYTEQDGKLTAVRIKSAKEVREKRAEKKAAIEKQAADEKK
jgi:hypothetical protein